MFENRLLSPRRYHPEENLRKLLGTFDLIFDHNYIACRTHRVK